MARCRFVLLLVCPALALDGQPGNPRSFDGRDGTTASSTPTAPALACPSWSPTTDGRGGGPAPLMQALPGGRPGPDVHRARRQQHLGAGRDPRRRQVLPLLLRARHAAEVRDRPAGRQDARSGFARTTSGKTAARSSGPMASRTAMRSTRASSAIRPTDRCGSPTARTSATSAWSS